MKPLTEEQWVRAKLELPENATLQDIQKKLHVICANSASYEKYIATYKCEDKDGEIARLTRELEILNANADSAENAQTVCPECGGNGFIWNNIGIAIDCPKCLSLSNYEGTECGREE